MFDHSFSYKPQTVLDDLNLLYLENKKSVVLKEKIIYNSCFHKDINKPI